MQTNQDSKKKKQPILYGGLTYFFLLLLAIFWSVDISLIYIFLSAALIFLFFTIKTLKPWETQPDLHQFKKKREDINEIPDILHDLKTTLKEKGISFNKEQVVTSSQKKIQRNIVLAIGIGFLFFFIAIFVIVFLGDNYDEAKFYNEQGEIYYDKGEYDSAYLYYKKAFTLNNESLEAITGLGNTMMMKEQYDSAIIMYDKALLIDRHYERALYQKALVLYYQQQYDGSIKVTKGLLEVNPSYFEAMQLIGDNYYSQERYDSALTWYDDAYKNGLRNRYLCHLMGYINQTQGKTQKAIDLYKEALQYDSTVVDIYERLAGIVPDNEKEWYRKKISELQAGQ